VRFPWQRQPGESARAYELFCMYRDLPPRERSIARLVSDLVGDGQATKGRRRGDVERLSARWQWPARAAAWDDEIDRKRREAIIDRAVELAERRAVRTSAALHLIARVLERAIARLEAEDALDDLSVPQVVDAALASVRLLPGIQAEEAQAVGGLPGAPPGVAAYDPGDIWRPAAGVSEDDSPITAADKLGAVLSAMEEAGFTPTGYRRIEEDRPDDA
jgi:hypothetical protein